MAQNQTALLRATTIYGKDFLTTDNMRYVLIYFIR